MKKILEWISAEINYAGFRKWMFRRVVKRHLIRYYTPDDSHPLRDNDDRNPVASDKKLVVYMSDGKRRHGGLADRFRGMVSLFDICLEKGYDFRIFFNSPFPLERFLLPASYDWRISETQMTYNSGLSVPVYAAARRSDDEREKRWQRRVLSEAVDKDFSQIHCYTNFYFAEDKFAHLFNMLFRPAPQVEAEVEKAKKEIGGEYISVSTRFLQLLGDFKEPKDNWTVLGDKDALRLMDGVLKKIKEIQQRPENAGKKVLVTSDSRRFLNFISSDTTLYSISGSIAHIDVGTVKNENHLKTFVDFFAIKGASSSYLVVGPGMYGRSNFSKRAAQAGGRDIIIENIIV